MYIPANHDASLAMLAQMLQGQFEVHREWVHGDQFDGLFAPGVTGSMHRDLRVAIGAALSLSRAVCVAAAAAFTCDAATSQFLAGLAPIGAAGRATLPLGHSSAMIGAIGARRAQRQTGDAS
ncbi:MAG TPA: hypothetical protein VGI91_05745 [Steroidobacteraceae bacterium]